jgi:sulfur transfer complex TusBCD TusB component (DsrH family)
MGGIFGKQKSKGLAAQTAAKVTEQDKVVLVSEGLFIA